MLYLLIELVTVDEQVDNLRHRERRVGRRRLRWHEILVRAAVATSATTVRRRRRMGQAVLETGEATCPQTRTHTALTSASVTSRTFVTLCAGRLASG